MAGVDSYGHIVSYIDRMPGTLASLTCRRKYRMKFLTFSGTNVPICEDILGSAFFKCRTKRGRVQRRASG
jgi:hypothetical protein